MTTRKKSWKEGFWVEKQVVVQILFDFGMFQVTSAELVAIWREQLRDK